MNEAQQSLLPADQPVCTWCGIAPGVKDRCGPTCESCYGLTPSGRASAYLRRLERQARSGS